MQQRTGLDPIFVRGIDFEAFGTGVARRAACTTPVDLAAEVIGQHRMGEREHAFRVQVVLAVALGSSDLREPIVDLNAAAAAGMAEYAVDDAPAVFVFVETQHLEVVQGT